MKILSYQQEISNWLYSN